MFKVYERDMWRLVLSPYEENLSEVKSFATKAEALDWVESIKDDYVRCGYKLVIYTTFQSVSNNQ